MMPLLLFAMLVEASTVAVQRLMFRRNSSKFQRPLQYLAQAGGRETTDKKALPARQRRSLSMVDNAEVRMILPDGTLHFLEEDMADRSSLSNETTASAAYESRQQVILPGTSSEHAKRVATRLPRNGSINIPLATAHDKPQLRKSMMEIVETVPLAALAKTEEQETSWNVDTTQLNRSKRDSIETAFHRKFQDTKESGEHATKLFAPAVSIICFGLGYLIGCVIVRNQAAVEYMLKVLNLQKGYYRRANSSFEQKAKQRRLYQLSYETIWFYLGWRTTQEKSFRRAVEQTVENEILAEVYLAAERTIHESPKDRRDGFCILAQSIEADKDFKSEDPRFSDGQDPAQKPFRVLSRHELMEST